MSAVNEKKILVILSEKNIYHKRTIKPIKTKQKKSYRTTST